MASWKKVLVSGSNIEVNEITASSVPGGGGAEQLLALDSASGGLLFYHKALLVENPQYSLFTDYHQHQTHQIQVL